MEVIKVNMGDVLIVDPGYIKTVWCEWEGEKELRFDLLRCEKVLHDGDDGAYEIEYGGEKKVLGVDSGRIWQMVADFDGYVELDAGISGYMLVPKQWS